MINKNSTSLATALAVLGALTALLARPAPALAQEPVIQEVRIAVQDLKTKQKLTELSPGDTLHMKVGDRVRLRLVALPGGRRAPRYPSTEFSALAGTKRIELTNIDVKVGSVDVEAVSALNPGNNQATTLIAFEIQEDLQFVKRSMKGGTLTVEVVEPPVAEPVRPGRPERPDFPDRPGQPQQPDRPNWPNRPDRPDRPGERGITLYEHQDFHGVSETFTTDVRDLRGTRIQPDRASSVMLDRGCEAILYEHPDFQGRSSVIRGPVEDLSNERVGNDTLSSFRLDCSGRGAGGERGITLYEHQDFAGVAETFTGDVRDLRGTRIREDRASSVRLDRGCEAILYEHPNFQGRSTVMRGGSIEDLNNERVGNDTLSSLRLDCSGQGVGPIVDRPDVGRPGNRLGVTLYDDTGFRGRSETFRDSTRDLRGSRVGDDRARSVRVDPGCRARLWTGYDYRGESLDVDRDVDDLSRTRIGFDSVTSVEVDCNR